MPPKSQYGQVPGLNNDNSDTINCMWCVGILISIFSLVSLVFSIYAIANTSTDSGNGDIAVYCFHGERQDNLLESQEDPLPTANPVIIGTVGLRDFNTRLCWDLQYISNIQFVCSIYSIGFYGPANLTDPGDAPLVRTIKDMGFILNSGSLHGCHSISRSIAQKIIAEPAYHYMRLAFRNFGVPEEVDGCVDITVRGYLSGLCHAPFLHAADDDDDAHGSHGGHHHSHNPHAANGHNFDSQSPAAHVRASAAEEAKYRLRAIGEDEHATNFKLRRSSMKESYRLEKQKNNKN